MKKKYISPKVMFEEMEASYLLINSKFNEEEGSGKRYRETLQGIRGSDGSQNH